MATKRTLREIAIEIKSDWRNPNVAAKPYLNVMETLNTINDKYYYNSGKIIVRMFLINAKNWHGSRAKSIKTELNQLIG